jgi:glycosyltransferase involved in cell wall biosynthesis
VIYNVIKLSEAREKAEEFSVEFEDHPHFISMGRLHSRKGFDLLMKVHKRLLEEGFAHHISIIGGGNEMENLENLKKGLNVENSFHLLGSQLNPWPYVKAADFFILPSKSESYPLTIGEVMALHKPIISTNVGGIPEMIDDGIDGILVNVDEDEIYEAMKSFLTNPELTEKLIEGTKKADKKFDENKIYNQITEIFLNQFELKNES